MTIESPPRARATRGPGTSSPTPTRAAGRGEAAAAAKSLPMPPRLPARRSPRGIALGLVAVCLGGLLSWVAYADIAQQTSVLSLTRTVHRGETIKTGDLATVSLSRSAAVSTVPAADLPDLVGQTALVDLVHGALLPRGAIGTMTLPSRGRAVVGLQLAHGRLPTGLLPASTPVRLVTLPADEAQATVQKAAEPSAPKTFFGRVVDYTDSTDGASVLLNVDVPAEEAPRISLLAATDRLAVLRDAE